MLVLGRDVISMPRLCLTEKTALPHNAPEDNEAGVALRDWTELPTLFTGPQYYYRRTQLVSLFLCGVMIRYQ